VRVGQPDQFQILLSQLAPLFAFELWVRLANGQDTFSVRVIQGKSE